MPAQIFLPLKGFSLDTADSLMAPDMARYLKNVVYSVIDTSQTGTSKGSQSGLFKPIESVQVYDETFSLPPYGYNHFVGGFYSGKTNEALFFNYNEEDFHGLYKVNGETRKIQTVYKRSYLNLQLAPEHFIHEGGATLQIFNFTDPNTELPRKRSYFMWVDGYNDFRFLCIEDSIATGGFDPLLFPYFQGSYDPTILINAGVPTPLDCMTVSEVVNDTPTLPNELKFHTWQFRVTFIDVYGRPSEHGIITDAYVPGVNDCLGASDFISRCLDLNFKIDNPLIDKVQIEFRNCNDLQWYLDTVLSLYSGSNLGDWWLRPRNPKVNYNSETKTVTYRFCKDKECNPIPQTETNRLQNPIPKQPQSAAPIGNTIGLANNKDGNNPFSQELMDQISIQIVPPEDQGDTGIRMAEIFVPIWNVYIGTQQPVYQLDNKQWVWGGRKDHTSDYVNNIVTGYQMFFGDLGRSGFIGYLAGAGTPPISTVSELYYVNSENAMIKVEDFSIIHRPTNTGGVFGTPNYDRKYFLKFTFSNISAATYIFRIADHRAKLSDPNFYKTSTYVAGQYFWASKQVNFFNRTNVAKELIVDLCAGNYTSLNDNKVLVIWDMTEPRNGGGAIGEPSRSKIVAGYIYAGTVDGEYDEPIELLNTNIYGDDNRNGNITDHNGFYFGSVRRDNGFDCEVFGFCACVYKSLHRFRVDSNQDILHERTFDLESTGTCKSYPNDECNRIIITGRVTQCGADIGVPGVGVVLSRGQVGITNSNGEFTIIAHDDAYIASRIRLDSIYYTPVKCALRACDSICIDRYDVVINPCVGSCNERRIEATDRSVFFESKRGLLSAGHYGVGITGWDIMTRHTNIQTKDEMYFTTPTLIDTQTFAPSQIKVIIPPTATFPLDIKKLTFSITKELSLSDYIEWIVDRVEFIDNSGNENNVAPTQIKIYYSSLNEYNVQNNFNTTTHWQFIVQAAPQVNYTSDYVEFYVNGDGQFFPKLTRALIKYDQTGQYFLIDYDPALKDLKQYALIRLGRPNDCVERDVFYEVCASVDVVNGKAQANEIILNAFDTYYTYRQIPIPVETAPDETENVIRTLGFPFEHNSPSDFWGEKCGNFGRQNVRNPYEAKITRKNQVALTGTLSDNGQLNFLNYFDDAKKTNFVIDVDGIVSMLPEQGVVLMVCQDNCFIVGYDDNLLRVVGGNIQQSSADDRFGRPERKIGNNYGCRLFDKNTIRKREGLVQFLDTSKSVLIQHNYSDGEPVSENVIGSWLRPKVKYINEWNRNNTNKKYWVGGIDPAANSYLLSDFTIESTEYTNSERETNIQKQESLSFDIYTKAFRAAWIFTPQGYLMLDSDLLERQLFSFAERQLYYHYSTNPDKKYGRVYGKVAEKVIRFVAVVDQFKKKTPLGLQNYCAQSKFFADQILTDSGQESRILLDHFEQGNFFSSAGFLCDLNTPADPNIPDQTGANKITDGDNLVASTIDIRLIGDPSKNEVYCEYQGSVVGVMAQEQSGG
jgi:hypothetical protein